MAISRADLRQYARDTGMLNKASDQAERQINRAINNALRRLGNLRDWPCLRKRGRLLFRTPKRSTATNTMVANKTSGNYDTTESTFVPTEVGDGSGTGDVGGRIVLPEDDAKIMIEYAISDCLSATSAVGEAYLGTTGGGKAFRIQYPQYSLPDDFARLFSPKTNNFFAGLTRLGSADELDILKRYSLTPGTPSHYYIAEGGSYIEFYPAPEEAEVVTFWYQRRPTEFSTDSVPTTIDWDENHMDIYYTAFRYALEEERGVITPDQALTLTNEAFKRYEPSTKPMPPSVEKAEVSLGGGWGGRDWRAADIDYGA